MVKQMDAIIAKKVAEEKRKMFNIATTVNNILFIQLSFSLTFATLNTHQTKIQNVKSASNFL